MKSSSNACRPSYRRLSRGALADRVACATRGSACYIIEGGLLADIDTYKHPERLSYLLRYVPRVFRADGQPTELLDHEP